MARKTVMRRHSKTLPMSGDIIVDVEGQEIEMAGRAARLLDAVEADAPIALPNPEDLAAEQEQGHDPETGELTQEQPQGMTEVDEETARKLDAGNDGTLSEENTAAAEGPADEDRGEAHVEDEKPAWWPKVEAIRNIAVAAKNKQQLKDADDEFMRIRAGLPDDVIADLESMLTTRRNDLSRPAAGGEG
jgi:recombination protein RecT